MEDKRMMIHGNIATFKFGLDENWNAKIEDFEWAVFLPPNKKDEVMCKRTYFDSMYHVDPEYAKTSKLKRESDVYSFEVVMFEILCGRRADQNYLTESEEGPVHVARQSFSNGTIEDIMDPKLKEETDMKMYIQNRGVNKDSLHIFLKVANQCVTETQDQRPTMKVVFDKLEKALIFQEEGVQRLNNEEALEVQLMHGNTVGKNLEHLKIPLTHIQSATHDFSNEHRIANFPEGYAFYRAEIEHYDKENPSSKRKNNVLIKRCLSGTSEMILIIEDFSHEFLGDFLGDLKDKRLLTWEKRLKISVDVAYALNYIHFEMEDQKAIINRDINCYNIGLDENLGAKIVDFWYSVFLPPNQDDEALYLKYVGKRYYADPEYKMTFKLKRQSDVYSFGVVLFELLCGRASPCSKTKL
ncbi:calmodulin-binding receptor-like cytoplasmic kinase 2 [Helianthus annuus]|uniref:calmodulin-binding receptor-like cytoplasmic kinase 2 n=1 Tax=Helianthus annuus TaxID=4232 RepID=UPI001652D549|nr:calmodulin-binding receptor-like cytoplasmic kinase 2 [Helianthus annuus]